MVICTDALLEQEYWETLYIRNMLLAIGKSSMFFFKVGKANGLTMLLDAETFDYMYQVKWLSGRNEEWMLKTSASIEAY